MHLSLTPATAREHLDRAIQLGTRMSGLLGLAQGDGFDSFRAVLVNGRDSMYNPLRGEAVIAWRPYAHAADGALRLTETVLHEGTHHVVRRLTGWPGLVAGARPGAVGEGLAQVIAGATLVLQGATPTERDFGWRALDPHGQTTPIGGRDVPLSLTMDDVKPWQYLGDMGGVHVHAGIVQHAHTLVARALGVEAMVRITGDAMRHDLGRATGFVGWRRATIAAAVRLHGTESREVRAVRDAWDAVGVRR